MCRGFQPDDRDRLKIKAFYIHLSTSTKKDSFSPDSLTLHYLPRINGSSLEINGSSIRPDSPAFVTLHRAVSAEKMSKGIVYGSREKVKASEGSSFEIYMNDVKVLKGIFRKDEGQNWKVECKSGDDVEGVKDAEVCIAVEGHVEVMTQKVEMVVRKKRKGSKCVKLLEEIPEETEMEKNEGCCCCCECRGEVEMEGGDCEMEEEMEMEMDGVRWAVDVGIWVVCLGFGYLVTSNSLRRRRRLFSR